LDSAAARLFLLTTVVPKELELWQVQPLLLLAFLKKIVLDMQHNNNTQHNEYSAKE
jgi:hypothetical protein